MKRTLSLLALLMTIAISFAQTTKTFKYGEIEGLINNGCIDIQCVFSPAKAGTIEITATDLGFEYLETKCSKGTLTISIKKNRIQHICKEYRQAVIYYSNALTLLQINGSGSIVIPSIDTKKSVTFQINGSGELHAGNVKTRELVASINGSGDIEVSQVSANTLTAAINGSGDLKIKFTDAAEISATVVGSGDIDLENISASQVDASVIGSGDIDLSGTTKEANLTVSGSGDIEAHKLRASQIIASANASGEITYNKSANNEITILGHKSNIIAK